MIHICNLYLSQVSQKWISISVTLGLRRNYIYKEVSQNKNFIFCESFCSYTLPIEKYLPVINKQYCTIQVQMTPFVNIILPSVNYQLSEFQYHPRLQ